MRKILGLLMMLFSLCCFAGTAVGEVEANQVVDVILEKGNSDYETVAEVYGPTGPNTCVWNVQNGYLYVTITEDAGPEILQQGQYFFTVRTTSSSYYTLVFEVR